MRRDRGADIWAGAMHDVEHAIWQTGLTRNLAQHVSRHGRQFARLGDGCVSDRNRRRDFPAEQIKGQIPWRNQSRDTARLTQCVVERHVVGDVRFGFGVQNGGGEESEVRDCARNIQRTRE